MMSKEERIHKLINNGEYQGVKFWIVKNGFRTEEMEYVWYCAYVQPPRNMLRENITKFEAPGGICEWVS